MKNKKGELTTEQIVVLIILIASFAVILFLLFRLNIGKQTNQELCRNSVVLRGKSVFPTDTIKLECYRSYNCITNDGSCEGLNNPEVTKANTLDEVYSQLAKNMYNCWWMFGQGTVDYVGTKATKSNYCSICSQVLLDSSLNKIPGLQNGQISKDGLYDYLAKTNIVNSKQTYAQYIFGTNSIDALKQLSAQNKGAGTFGTMQIGKQFFVVTGITSEVSKFDWTGIGTGAVAVAGIGLAFTPIGWGGIAITAITTGIASGAGGYAVSQMIEPEITAIIIPGKGIENKFMAPMIVEANSDRFKALNCGEILTLS